MLCCGSLAALTGWAAAFFPLYLIFSEPEAPDAGSIFPSVSGGSTLRAGSAQEVRCLGQNHALWGSWAGSG